MERQILLAYLRRHRSEKYDADLELFFNEANKVIGIHTSFATVVAVKTDAEEQDMMLLSYLFNGQTAEVNVFSKRLFVIPKKSDVNLYKSSEEQDLVMLSAFPAIYEVADYGFLERENFKGAKMSRCILNVLVANTSSDLFEATFKAGDDIVAGTPTVMGSECYYEGLIQGGFQFTTIGRYQNGMVILDLKKE